MSFFAAAGICLAAFLLATIVLMSGFGLGTLLTPLFVIFYDIKIAVFLVAVVHFSNNLFKLGLFFHHLDWAVLKRFGALSVVGAFVGSLLQARLESQTLKIGLGILLVILGVVEFLPPRLSWRIPKRLDPLGSVFSGLLGGVLGNQGAVRSAYLLNYSLSKEAFVATATVIACLIDATRIPIYLVHYHEALVKAWPYLLADKCQYLDVSASRFRVSVNTLVSRSEPFLFEFIVNLVKQRLLCWVSSSQSEEKDRFAAGASPW